MSVLTILVIAYFLAMVWLAWKYLKPPKDPPPSGKADATTSFALPAPSPT